MDTMTNSMSMVMSQKPYPSFIFFHFDFLTNELDQSLGEGLV